jgi:hypothetical protein
MKFNFDFKFYYFYFLILCFGEERESVWIAMTKKKGPGWDPF